MLFDASRHETITKNLWGKKLVQTEISSIIDDIECSLLPEACWPTHPLDAESYPRVGPKWSAYAGAAGAIHALQILSRYDYKVSDLSGLLETVYQSFLKAPDVSVEPGLQIGELGILMPAILTQAENEPLSKNVQRCMEATIAPPLYEITSGQTGMMHAALALYRKTGESCWKNCYLKGAASLMDNWVQDTDTGEWLWESQVFGSARNYYGACHGLVGNANILLQGIDLLPEGTAEIIMERTISTLNVSVKQEVGLPNTPNLVAWPICNDPKNKKMLVQWCHGAAGIITAMARTPRVDTPSSKRLDQLLEDAGELVWQAGPLLKGSNICHGTAGNGYAFLYLYQRWGDSVWLDRARKFAMHAVEQCRNDRIRYGQGRFTLWTGDAGLAIYLYHCLNPEKAAIPGLDLF